MKHSLTPSAVHLQNSNHSSDRTKDLQALKPMMPGSSGLMRPLTRFSRAHLTASIADAISHFVPTANPEIAEYIAADLAASTAEVAAHAFELGVRSATGPETAGIIIGSIFNKHSVPNGKLTHGKTRAAASKAICRARRMLGLLPEKWQNARLGHLKNGGNGS